MFDFEDALKRIDQQRVLCIGDLMLDDFVYGFTPLELIAAQARRCCQGRR
jgi:bifunctional ADP-heptose synthase (sugar kinase/adenylyltransferase)